MENAAGTTSPGEVCGTIELWKGSAMVNDEFGVLDTYV